MKPGISVVVCAKNEEKYIGECLRRLDSQRPRPEIVVVDGHSTDRTVKLAKEYADKIVFDNKAGISDARNVGWKAASGEIVAYCDADARPHQGWVRSIIEEIEGNLAVSGPLSIYDGGLKLKLSFKFWADMLPRFTATVGFNNVWGANMAFRKDALRKEPFRARFLEDFEIGRRHAKMGKVRFTKALRLSVSSRRFEKSFHRTSARFYIPAALRLLLFKDYEQRGYFRQKDN